MKYKKQITTNIQKIVSKRGRDNILFRNVIYYKVSFNSDLITWRCNKKTCNSRIKTNHSFELLKYEDHNHAVMNETEKNVLLARKEIDFLATNGSD